MTVPGHHLMALGVVTALAAAAAPAVAGAATISVTGDDGNPVAIVPGAGPTIRNMTPQVGVAFPPGPGRYRLAVTNAAGASASTGSDCNSRLYASPSRVNYTGNGAYTVTLTNFAATDYSCAAPQSTEISQFVISAFTALTPPAGRFVLRAAGDFQTNVLSLPINLNPGAASHEVRFATNPKIGPDGAIAGASNEASPDSATGQVRLSVAGPGVYTVVARPTVFSSLGVVGAPWSAPVKVVVAAPFDASGGLTFVDSVGPSYSVRLQLREKSARGHVTVSLARGTKRGTYHKLGKSVSISSLGTIAKRFTATRTAAYRLRFTFKGSQTILPGKITIPIRIQRRYISG